jgi:hypothetical protein
MHAYFKKQGYHNNHTDNFEKDNALNLKIIQTIIPAILMMRKIRTLIYIDI